MTRKIAAVPSIAAVASSVPVCRKAPSPKIAQTGVSGFASLAPIAAGKRETDARHAAGGDVLAWLVDRKLVEDLVLRIGGVGHHDGVARQGLARFDQNLRRRHRLYVGGAQRPQILLPLHLEFFQLAILRGRLVVARLCRFPQLVQNLAEHRLGVAENANLHRVVLADLEAVDVDLDQLGRRDIEGDTRPVRRRNAIGKAAADGQDDIGGPRHGVARNGTEVAAGAGEEVVVLGETALAHERRGDGRADELGDRLQFRGGFRLDDAAAREQDRALGLEQKVDRPGDIVRVAEGSRLGTPFLSISQRNLGGLGLDILRHVEQDRALASFQHGVEGLLKHVRQLFDVARARTSV